MACLLLISTCALHAQLDSMRSDTTMEEILLRVKALEDVVIPEEEAPRIQIGISFGFNYFSNATQGYYVTGDSMIGAYGKRNGYSGMLSAMLGYRLTEKHSLLLNVPLGDLSGDPSRAIGVFNRKIAGGLGYGYNVDRMSFIAVLNLYPYEELALDVVRNKKLDQEPFTVLDTSNLPKQQNVSPSVTIGICYYLVNARRTEMINF